MRTIIYKPGSHGGMVSLKQRDGSGHDWGEKNKILCCCWFICIVVAWIVDVWHITWPCWGHILLVHSKEAVAVKWTITWLLRQSGRLIKSGWKGNLYSVVCLLFRSTRLSALQTDHSKLNLKLIPLLLSSICSKRQRDHEERSWEGGGERKEETNQRCNRQINEIPMEICIWVK